MRVVRLSLALATLLAAGAALAADGVREINQVSATAGGFPVVLGPGSYRLTSDLQVPGLATTAIRVTADRVTLDLGGFAIRGPNDCGGAACTLDVGAGIEALPGTIGTKVVNGAVTGMGGDGIRLGDHAHVEGVLARANGSDGITVGAFGLVLANRAVDNGNDGIEIGTQTLTANNVAVRNNQAGSGGLAMRFARGGAPNVCDDRSCASGSQKRVYLTSGNFNGAQAAAACTAGFHMASLWEIHDPTQLSYDHQLGVSAPDAGGGPPASSAFAGWVRTGYPAGGALDLPGNVNCSEYTSIENLVKGSIAHLQSPWPDPAAGAGMWPWTVRTQLCQFPARVWCVQD